MQNYVDENGGEFDENGDQRINAQENVEAAPEGQIVGDTAGEQPKASEISSEESITPAQRLEKQAENTAVDPRRFGLMRLTIGIIISSISCNLIIGGNQKFYGVLTIGLIWVLMGFKEFLFPKRGEN